MPEEEHVSIQYFSRTAEETLESLSVDDNRGLSSEEAEKRLDEFGPNALPGGKGASAWKLFLKQFKDFLILILFLAAGISIYAGQMANAYIILAVILFNATMGFVQEYKAEKAVKSIKNIIKQEAIAVRDGEKRTIRAKYLVPGDIIELHEGQTVPADCRLLEVKHLRTDEASLTGESEPVAKKTDKIGEDTELANRSNMAWKGTHVVRGSGRGAVVSTGKETEIGKIAASLTEMEKSESNFRKKTARLARKMALIALSTSAVVFSLGFFYRSFEFNDILLVTIATLVSSIPEGLPVVISIVLAIGASRMARQNAIIREFTATEVLGSVSTILTDKTGTITQSVLTVRRLFGAHRSEMRVSGQGYDPDGQITLDGEEVEPEESGGILSKMLLIAAFCNQANVRRPGHGEEKEEGNGEEEQQVDVSGDPTEVALEVLAQKTRIRERSPFDKVEILDDIPFNSQQRFRATLIRYGGRVELLAVGAPEKILDLSARWLTEDGARNLDEDSRGMVRRKNDEWAEEALRVIALAYREMPEDADRIDNEDVRELTWTGLTGMMDPPRPQVELAVEKCREAGIRVMMVTGDYSKTAVAIARNVGIIAGEDRRGEFPEALSEKELREMEEEEFDRAIREVSVFSRITPDTKLRIAQRLQDQGELICMTGDGVNDAPALKKADVGIAMGRKGTDVAKDAANIVLTDDDFSSLVNAVHEGRIIFKNVKSTSYFLLTTNFASTSTLMAALLAGLPIPLTAVQILWVNIVTDGIMDVAKSTEPGHGDMMKRSPVRKDERILTWDILPYLLIMASIMVGLAILTLVHYLPSGVEKARTGAFLVIAMTQVFNVFNMRDMKKSVFSIGLFSNKWINMALAASFLLQYAVVQVPFLRSAFGFSGMPIADFFVITAMSTTVLWAGEAYKYLRYRSSR